MNQVFIQFLRRAFDIREGEILRAVLMQANIFLLISTLLIVKPTVNGLFLAEMGVEQLPLAFVLVAVFAVIISTAYARFLGRLSLNRILLTTLFSSVLLFVLFGFLLRLQVVGGWVLYAFYIWVSIFGVLTASQFWILANVVFNAREAKRLFGFIGAGAIAGGIFGGYLTTILVEGMGSENLPFVGAALLCLCIPITTFIWNKYVLPTQSRFQRRKKIPKTDHPLQLIRRSPHLTYLAGIIGMSVIIAKLVDYQFNAIASSKISDPDELTAFFGFWFSSFNVISLTFQLLLTRRLVGTLGVGSSLLFLPLSILLGAVIIFFVPELWAAIFIKTSDGSLKQSINKAAVELLALPIPANIKNQTKTFIDVVVDSLATGLGGLILIFLVNGLDLSIRFISLMIVGLISIWLFFARKVRSSYLQSFRVNVQKVHKNGDGQLDLTNESVVSDLKTVLASGSENQILYVLKKLKNQPDSRFFEAFQQLLQHPAADVREQAIRNLYFLKNPDLVEVIATLIKDPSQNMRIAAFDYLIAHAPEQTMARMESYLNDDDYRIRSAALISLAEESRDNPVLVEKFELERRFQKSITEMFAMEDPALQNLQKIGLLKAMGMAKMPVFFSFIEQLLENKNQQVASQAILSAGDTMHPYFIPKLIRLLERADQVEYVQAALMKYGREIIQELLGFIQSPDAQPEIVRMIPPIIEGFGVQPAADLLFYLLRNEDNEVRLVALRSLNQLKIKHPYLHYSQKEVIEHLYQEARLYQDTLSILYVQVQADRKRSEAKAADIATARQVLISLLEGRLDSNLERIFRLLGLKYPAEDVISVFEGIQSQQPDLRVNALEYLDNLLDPGLKKVLIPIVETALLESISEEALRELNLKIPDEKECYELLLAGEDKEVKEAARHLLEELKTD